MSSEHLVQYGRSAFVGRFASPVPLGVERGDRVVVRSPRGVELGVVLGPADPRFAAALDPDAGGELLRPAGPGDTPADVTDVLAAAESLATERDIPLTFLDAEPLLDGVVLLHAVVWGECDADPLFAELSERFARPVRLFDVSRTPFVADPPAPASSGCGKPGCGSGGCSTGGCSTGGCSRGKVKSADDLTAYFADLREKMHSTRTPLN